MRILGRQELRDIVMGAGLFGAGGGGSTAEGMKLAERVLQFGAGVKLAEVSEIPDGGWGAAVAGVGSPKASLTRIRSFSPAKALGLLENAVGFTSRFVVPFETGAGNSINPMLAAIQRDIPIVDGDPVGRAVPELQMTLFMLGGIPLVPVALATEDDVSAVIRTREPKDAERVARAVTAELGGVAAIACYAMETRDMKRTVIPGTTTRAELAGASIRLAQGRGEDPCAELIRAHHGFVLGKGRISSLREETRGAFDYGISQVGGDLPVRVVFKNENLLAFRGDKLLAVAPDLICSVDSKGNPMTNADLREGMEITYIGFPAAAALRTPQACAMFVEVLAAADYHEEFVQLEKLAQ
ncbi:MAG TPA: DUF917 domain-containing protein [Spirochaetia bacterium]|nr:DUF917 domain-containing protein [Spirochaetia bacterium]